MPAIKIIYTFAAMATTFIAMDLLWLGVIAKKIYHDQIGFLLRQTPNWIGAISFYILFIIGVMIFCVLPAVEKDSLNHAILYGALFGFFTYMTYELTNYAVIKDWPLTIVPIDIAWGIILASVVSLVGFLIAKL